MKNTAIFHITNNGLELSERLKSELPGAEILKFSAAAVEKQWKNNASLVFIMATGIVVRTIAPLLKDKKTDPAVVVIDDAGKYVISLAGGHLGGANDLARKVAGMIKGEAVITTASDVNGLTAIDLWARDHDLVVENDNLLPLVGTRYVNNGALRVYPDQGLELQLPDDFLRVAEPRQADVIITNRRNAYGETPENEGDGDKCTIDTCRVKGQLYLRPRNLVVGIGCNSGTPAEEIEAAVASTFAEHNLAFLSLCCAATIDIKAEEPGLVGFVRKQGLLLRTFRAEELNSVKGITPSDIVLQATGAIGVAEPAALLAAGEGRLLVQKQKKGNVTVAIAIKTEQSAECGVGKKDAKEARKGRIFVVGTGPGSLEHLTPAAREAIRHADVIVGYGTYLDLIQDLLKDKEVLSTGMTQEVDRCRKAVELARTGRTVAVISGGDPGVYAMAGLVFEVLRSAECGMRNAECNKEINGKTAIPVEVIPGISALNAAASRLGAPLMHDFACISLSDRLTPWEMIEKRLDAAAAADFVIVLYNPRSKGRAGHINRAREIVLKHRAAATVVGIVKGAMREQEQVIVTDLGHMQDSDIDMQTTVVIGNSKTFRWNDLMITPRGYERKFDI
ncbi:MAG: precorrin-3B C(17)-methyltransferase [Nitrospirota bacterium]|nr:precorrin-3B C(17)-methyltransferase [Nitrospirota bacterium]